MNKKGMRLSGRIALVTGAARGIGRAVAIRYASEGAHVIVLSKNSLKLEELDDEIKALTGRSATLVALNLRNFEEIEYASHDVFKRFGRLDILVGNAAILGTLTPITHLEPSNWHKVLEVNLSANWHLLRAFDPLLKRSNAGRVIFVTSSVGSIVRSFWGAYAVSKSGLEMMTKVYASEQSKTKIKANLVNPGATRTDMRAQAMPGEDQLSVKAPEKVTETFVLLAEESCSLNGSIVNSNGEIAQ